MIRYQYLITVSSTERYLEKFGKRLIGRNDLEDALKKLDKLTHEEARMAIVELRRTAYAISENVRGVSGQLTAVGDEMGIVNNLVTEAINSARIISFLLKPESA